jgi:hypothetical protein
MVLLLIETLLLGFRKIPFTCNAPWIKGRQDRLDSFMLPIVSGKKSAA